jgi:hypothetical protein
MTRRLKWLIAVAAVLVLVAGGAAAWGHARESRAAGLAVKHGFASSKDEASLSDRCAGVMIEDFETSTDPRKAGIGEKAFTVLVPEVCELGVSRGLVAADGTMTEESGYQLTLDVMNKLGPDSAQTLIFNELAVNYGLAQPGKATRWHRCVAMAYSGWDAAQAQGASMPSREAWRRGARDACTEGIRRGIVPASGVPEVGSPEAEELFALVCASARKQDSCV